MDRRVRSILGVQAETCLGISLLETMKLFIHPLISSRRSTCWIHHDPDLDNPGWDASASQGTMHTHARSHLAAIESHLGGGKKREN